MEGNITENETAIGHASLFKAIYSTTHRRDARDQGGQGKLLSQSCRHSSARGFKADPALATPTAPALVTPAPSEASYDSSSASPHHDTPAPAPSALQHPPRNLRHFIHSARTLIIRSDKDARAQMHFMPDDCLDDRSEYVAAYHLHARRGGGLPSCWDARWASRRPRRWRPPRRGTRSGGGRRWRVGSPLRVLPLQPCKQIDFV